MTDVAPPAPTSFAEAVLRAGYAAAMAHVAQVERDNQQRGR